MIKIPKQKILATTILLAVLMISSGYMALSPTAHAQEITVATKGLTIIDQVAGVNLTKYNATTTLDVAGSYMGVLPTEDIRYTLAGYTFPYFGSRIEIQDTFTNGSLQIMDVLENSGSPQMPILPVSAVNMAKWFLLKYQGYSVNSFYGQLASTLNHADPTKNSTTTVGNINFDINTITGNSILGNSTTFTWSYTSNGVNADCKCVSLSYRNGFLKSFIDTWNLYPIGSTTVNLSEQQAEAIAMQNAKAYTWTVGSGNETYEINNFNITKPMVEQLVFCEAGNATNTRSSDPLMLYPMWRIGVGLDKYYPGNVYGIYVDVWADTGQVRSIQEVFSTLPPPAGDVATIAESSINNQTSAATAQMNPFLVMWIVLATFVVTTMGVVPVWLSRKKTSSHYLCLPKLRKIVAALLCLLIGSAALVVLVSAVPTVNAGSATIWGDNSTYPYLYHNSTERQDQQWISGNITYWFQQFCGYAYPNNMQGVGTYPSNVLTYTAYADQNYPPAATVWFDHGMGMQNQQSQQYYQQIQGYPTEWHFMLSGSTAVLNQPNGDVFDYQIYSATSTNHNYFSCISTCCSAALSLTVPTGQVLGNGTYGPNNSDSGYPIGMPYAWTHELTSSPSYNPPAGQMSGDGYAYPDSGAYCYIGFPYGSAALSQTVYSSYPTSTYYYFVSAFFYNALVMHDSVNQALDAAAYMCFPPDCFGATKLYSGFTAYWDQVGTMPNCNLVVYGNGNIYLYTGAPDYVSTPSISDNVPNLGVTGTQYTLTASSTDPCGPSIQYTFNWGDGSANTVTGWTSSGQQVQEPHTWSSNGYYIVNVTAQSSTGLSSQSSIVVTMGNMLSVYAWDYWAAQYGYQEPLNPNVYIDGNLTGTAPISIPVTAGYHTISLDSSTWDQYWNQYASTNGFYDQNWNYYSNGASVQVTSPSGFAAFYYP